MSYSRPFPIHSTLTAISLAFRNPAATLIHERVLPPVAVLSQRFTWMSYPLHAAFTLPDMEVGRKGQLNQVEFSATEESSFVRDFGLEDVIPLTDLDEAEQAWQHKVSTYNPEHAATENLTNLVQLGREVRAAALVQDSNNYDADRRLTIADADDKFSSFATSDPFEVLDEGMRKPLVYRANTITMGQPVWEVLKRHPKLIKAVKGGTTAEGAITRAQFAELMEVDPEHFLVGVSMVNQAKPGQPVNLVKVWGNSIQLLYLDASKQSPTDHVLTWGFTAKLGDRMAGTIDDPNVGIKGGRRVRVGEQVNEVVCAKSLGYIIRDPIEL